MDGFRQNPKMKSQIACFKEGGSTNTAKRESKRHEKSDVAEDKKIIKKAVAQHEGAKHKGEEKTELKLKNGGRTKKEKGTVRKFKSGGAIEMAKGKDDKKTIANIKKTKAGKADAPSAASGKKKDPKKAPKKTMVAQISKEIIAEPMDESAAMGMPYDQPIQNFALGGVADAVGGGAMSNMTAPGLSGPGPRPSGILPLPGSNTVMDFDPTGGQFGGGGMQSADINPVTGMPSQGAVPGVGGGRKNPITQPGPNATPRPRRGFGDKALELFAQKQAARQERRAARNPAPTTLTKGGFGSVGNPPVPADRDGGFGPVGEPRPGYIQQQLMPGRMPTDPRYIEQQLKPDSDSGSGFPRGFGISTADINPITGQPSRTVMYDEFGNVTEGSYCGGGKIY